MAKVVYDEHYKTNDYFGAPYKGLVQFFETYQQKGTVLDLGCGQGRDSIPIAKMGYDVIAVDHSKVGIEALKRTALAAGVKIDAVVWDVYSYSIEERVDIVLLDSMLHFYKNDVKKESEFVKRILKELKQGGVFINFIIKGKKREDIIKNLINESEFQWDMLSEKYVDYPEVSAKYHMIAVKKTSN